MSSLLFPESPLLVLRSLAKKIGLNEAIVTQQLYWLLDQPGNGRTIEGHRWIFNTYEEWRMAYFPFWSARTIERVFANLHTMGIVESCQPEGRESRRKYYRLNEGMKLKLLKGDIPDPANLADSEPEDANMAALIPPICVLPSNTKKTSKKTVGAQGEILQLEAESKRDPIPTSLSSLPDFAPAWKEFTETRKKKRKPLTDRASASILNRLAERPQSAIVAVDAMLEFGWDSFEWGWDKLVARLATKTNGHKPDTAPAGYPDFIASPEGRQYATEYPRWATIPPSSDFVKRDFHNWMKAKA